MRFITLLLAVFATPLVQAADGTQQIADLGTCHLVSGAEIQHCRIGYRTWGTLNASRSNAILFPTWFSGTSAALTDSVGADRLVDPSKYFVIAVDALTNGVSSSPSNSPAPQHGPDFPAVTIQDMVNTEYRLITETLGIKHLHAVMGISMGGIQTFEWLVDYPEMMDLAIPIVGSPRPTSFDLLFIQTEEDALRSDPEFHQGRYEKSPPVPVVHQIHELFLSTPTHFAAQESPDKFRADFPRSFSEGILPFDANDWLYGLVALSRQDIGHGGSLEDAAKKVRAKVLIINAAQDHMVNPKPALDFAPLIGAKTIVLTSDCGHLAPGCEAATLFPAVRAFLDTK
jgi:homoserine O-acetyltransferase/O-succinyltransferase